MMQDPDHQDTPWYYLDPKSRERKGPMSASVIKRLLEKGLLGLDITTQVWQTGMDQWKTVGEIPEFNVVVEFQRTQWYYVDLNNQQQGPIVSRFLIHKLKEGELDGLTLVYGGKYAEWKKLSEIPELKEAMRKIAEEEEAMEQARANLEIQEEKAQLIAQQTYIPLDDEILQPAYDKTVMSKNKQVNDKTSRGESTENKDDAPKYFEDDNGNKFKWDEVEQDWVMMDDEDEGEFNLLLSEQQEKSTNHNKRNSSNLTGKKRNHGNMEEDDPEDENRSVTSHQSSISDANNDVKGAEENQPKRKRGKSRKKRKTPPTWIYVEGLPGDITFDELKSHFSKVGLIALNTVDQQPRIKIYRDPDSNLCKGDCSICYAAEESVQLALDVFDGGFIRPNFKISVTRATFDYAKPAANASTATTDESQLAPAVHTKQPTGTKNHAQIKVARNAMRAALSWNEDDDSGIARSAALRIVVLEGMFSPTDFKNPSFENELEVDTASECEKFGTIEKLTIFSKHPRGIIILKFSTGYAAQECIRVMNGRFFAGRKVKAFFWDGVTNYTLQSINTENEEKEEEERLEEFGNWLEQEQAELPEEFRLRTE